MDVAAFHGTGGPATARSCEPENVMTPSELRLAPLRTDRTPSSRNGAQAMPTWAASQTTKTTDANRRRRFAAWISPSKNGTTAEEFRPMSGSRYARAHLRHGCHD